VIKGRMWIGHSIIGGYKMSLSCLLRSLDRTTMSTLYLYGFLLQERDNYNLYRMNTNEQLSQSVSHSEDPVDELIYVPHSLQNARAVSI
jgi:hypothetical protein